MTNVASNIPTKLCTQCNQIKPLHAFTQMAGGKFGERHSICLECRKKIASEKDKEDSGDFRAELKLRLGGEAKIFSEQENRQQAQNKEENEAKAHKENESTHFKTREKYHLREKTDKARRESLRSPDFFNRHEESKRSTMQILQRKEQQQRSSLERNIAENREESTAAEGLGVVKEKHKSAEFGKYLLSVASGSPLAAAKRIQAEKNSPSNKDPLVQHIERHFARRNSK